MSEKLKIPSLDFSKLKNESYHDYFTKETGEEYSKPYYIEIGNNSDLSLQKAAVIEYNLYEKIIKKNECNYFCNNDCNKLLIIVFSSLFCISFIIVGVFCFIIYL